MRYGPLQSVSEFTPEGCTHHIPIAESPWPLVSVEAAAKRCVELREVRGLPLIEKAEEFARAKHGTRERVGGGLEVDHLRRVAGIVGDNGPPVAVAAAWLHDIIEDCGVTPKELSELFGNEVARAVVELTDDPNLVGLGGAWRHERQVALAGVMSPDAALVKCADILDNAASMKVYKAEYYPTWCKKKREILQIIRPKVMDDVIWRFASDAVRLPGTPQSK